MQSNGYVGGFYLLCTWVSKLAYLNVLWILFSLFGVIFLGLFPSTVALFVVAREWINRNSDTPIFSTFWRTFKTEFIKSNLLGGILFVIGFILFVDMQFFFNNNTGVWMIINTITVMTCICYILMILYILPIYVHFDLSIIKIIQNSFLYMIGNIKVTIMMILVAITLSLSALYIPRAIFVFGGSIYAIGFMWFAKKAFRSVQQKKENYKLDSIEPFHD
jgi:uncharacterized membrane protein YesL